MLYIFNPQALCKLSQTSILPCVGFFFNTFKALCKSNSPETHAKKSVCHASVQNPWADKRCYNTEQKNTPHLTYLKSSSRAAELDSESD